MRNLTYSDIMQKKNVRCYDGRFIHSIVLKTPIKHKTAKYAYILYTADTHAKLMNKLTRAGFVIGGTTAKP